MFDLLQLGLKRAAKWFVPGGRGSWRTKAKLGRSLALPIESRVGSFHSADRLKRFRWARFVWARLVWASFCLMLVISYGLLVILSLGSGWSFPNLLPDRMDFAPWRHFLGNRDGLITAFSSSLFMSLCVSMASTSLGLVAGRALRSCTTFVWWLIAYLPFVLSPLIVGICLYDIQVRLGLVSTYLGVILAQFLFAFAFATIFFCEMWNPRIDRAEQLVKTLGGGTWAVWKHAILPQAKGLLAACAIQTALFSWLDFGLVSVLGGGNVNTITVRLFAYIREASVNQAAQSGIVLLIPPVAGCVITGALLFRSRLRSEPKASDRLKPNCPQFKGSCLQFKGESEAPAELGGYSAGASPSRCCGSAGASPSRKNSFCRAPKS